MPSSKSEAIILAGGLGTRLRGVIGEIPKCMAPVNGQPFLYYLLRYLELEKVDRIVLSLGYKSEVILEWLRQQQTAIAVDFVIEEKPLGTGGGIHRALEKCSSPDVFVVNGDTMFNICLASLMEFHVEKQATVSLALRAMENAERYGTVRTNQTDLIISFEEKSLIKKGMINGGVYIIHRDTFLQKDLPSQFSFEKDYLERFVHEAEFYGCMDDAYFIDIGVPADYSQAQTDFQSLFPA